MIICCHPVPGGCAVARRRPNLRTSAALGAVAGLLLAMWLSTTGGEAGTAPLPFVAGGALLGAVYNFAGFPDAKVCRIPRLLGGCGGSTTIQDTDGNSRPRRPCWGHPGGKPKRLVNLAVVGAEIALVVVALAVTVTVTGGG